MFLAISTPEWGLLHFVLMVGFLPFLPILLGATAVMNIMNRNSAAQTLSEPFETEQQTIGGTIQNFADRGLTIDRNSPIVKEALRRRSLEARKQQASATMGGPSWTDLLGVFLQD